MKETQTVDNICVLIQPILIVMFLFLIQVRFPELGVILKTILNSPVFHGYISSSSRRHLITTKRQLSNRDWRFFLQRLEWFW